MSKRQSNWLAVLLLGLQIAPTLADEQVPDEAGLSPETSNESAQPQSSDALPPGTIVVGDDDRLPHVEPLAGAPTALEVITVTATKRERLLHEVPASVSLISGQELEEAGAEGLGDILSRIPGVDLTPLANDYNRIAVRGMQSDNGVVTPAATGYFIDDVPFSDPFLVHARPDLPPFDLEAIELLKGPQGTLFGGSALAGALRYRLRDAQPGQWQSRGFVHYRSQADGSPGRSGGAAVNLPLGEDAGLRLVGVRRLNGGRIDDLRSGRQDTDSAEQTSARALLRWHLGEKWSVGLKAFHQRSRADDAPLAETTDGRLERERALRDAPYQTRADFLSLDLTHNLDWADVVSVSSLLRKDGALSGRATERTLGIESAGQPVDAPVTEDIEGFVQELRLVSADAAFGPWQWLLGMYGHEYNEVTTQILETRPEAEAGLLAESEAAGPRVELINYAGDVQARELALFGEVTRSFGERWQITAGLRAYRIRTEGETLTTGAIILATGSTENRNNANLEASGLNPRLALRMSLGDEMSSYLSVARGFRFGGIQLIGPSPLSPDAKSTYDPDSIWSYEWGLRSLWLDGALQADGALFYIDWNTPQVQTTTGGAVPLNTIDNVGHARSHGAELSLRYRPPIRGLQATLAAAYTDARTTRPYTAPSGDEVPPGARLPGSARYQVRALLDYDFRIGPSQAGLSLTHSIHGPGVNDIEQSLDILDYQSTDLRMNLNFASGFGLSLGVANLADNRAVVSAAVVDESNFTTIYNRTRSIDLRLEFAL